MQLLRTTFQDRGGHARDLYVFSTSFFCNEFPKIENRTVPSRVQQYKCDGAQHANCRNHYDVNQPILFLIYVCSKYLTLPQTVSIAYNISSAWYSQKRFPSAVRWSGPNFWWPLRPYSGPLATRNSRVRAANGKCRWLPSGPKSKQSTSWPVWELCLMYRVSNVWAVPHGTCRVGHSFWQSVAQMDSRYDRSGPGIARGQNLWDFLLGYLFEGLRKIHPSNQFTNRKNPPLMEPVLILCFPIGRKCEIEIGK